MRDATTLADLAPRAASQHGSKPFLVFWSTTRPCQNISFAEFEQWTRFAAIHVRRHLATALKENSSVRVAMLAHASADSLALSLAVPSCGGVLVQWQRRQPEATLATMLFSDLGCRC